MTTERPSAAAFDPVEAQIYGPQELRKDSGEAYSGPPVNIGSSPVKNVGLYTTIRNNQDHAQSQSVQYIDCRSEGLGENLTSDNFILHRQQRYDIIGRLNSDYRGGTTRYQVNTSNDFSFL